MKHRTGFVARHGGAFIERDGIRRSVKNLGWLLNNWRSVERFTVTGGPHMECALDLEMYAACDCWKIGYTLVAHLRNGGRYVTPFTNSDVLRRWLHRPVFRGVSINFCGAETVC